MPSPSAALPKNWNKPAPVAPNVVTMPGLAGGLSNGGMPELPTLGSPLMSNGQLAAGFTSQAGPAVAAQNLDLAKYAADPAALNKLKDYAMSSQASPWLKMQLESQGLGEMTARDQAAGQAGGAAAAARSAIAMRGGLSGGAAERLAKNQQNNLLMANQAIGRQGQLDRLGLNIEDQKLKMQTLSQIPGMDVAFANQLSNLAQYNASANLEAAKFNSGQAQQNNQFNTQNTLQAGNQENVNKLDIYKQQMAGYGANETAKATRNAGKK